MTGFDQFDLVIVGGNPGGITAAIAAARLGRRSLILERTAFMGGLPANGLGATDINTRGATEGLFLEFVQRIKAYYIEKYGPDSVQVRDCSDGYHFEPAVAQKVFTTWVNEHPQITVSINRQFDAEASNVVLKDGAIEEIRVLNRVSNEKERYRGLFFLDATYEGDLIAAAGVPYFTGREGKDEFNELGAGCLYKLWEGPECDGSTFYPDNAIQSYNYRLCLTNDPNIRVPFQKPEVYNRSEYTSLIMDVKSGIHTGVEVLELSKDQMKENIARAEQNLRPVPNFLHAIQRLSSMVSLPNSKADSNNQHWAFISTDLPEENWPYPTSNWEWRDKFAKRLRSYTEGLLYFAQHDIELPQWFREEVGQWGWARDEYVENGHFPRQVYVREGRRMKGKYFFTSNDALPVKEGQPPPIHWDSITASHYALDSHAVRKREPERAHLDGFFSYPSKPYTVPYGVMVPDAHVKNLLAPVPVSATHVGFSTLRMEPCWMAMGQAAGVAAAICIEDGAEAASIDISKLQTELLDQGAMLFYDDAAVHANSRDDRKRIQMSTLLSAKKLKLNGSAKQNSFESSA